MVNRIHFGGLTYSLAFLPAITSSSPPLSKKQASLLYHGVHSLVPSDAATHHGRDMRWVSYHRLATHLWCSDNLFDTTMAYLLLTRVRRRGAFADAIKIFARPPCIACHHDTITMACHRRCWTIIGIFASVALHSPIWSLHHPKHA